MSVPLLLYGLMSVTHAQGWSEPIITIDNWTYSSGHRASLQVTGTDTLHQTWAKYNNTSRVGYKVFQPDGTIIFPETMVSNDVHASFPTSCLVNQDSVAIFWREGAAAWFTLRDSTGSELVQTSLLFPESYVSRPNVEASSDSLGRIHCVFEISAGVCYAVYDPGTGEMFRDTIPGSDSDISNICVDGNRVHIYYTAGYELPAYIQYDLSGNIVVSPVELVQDLDALSPQSSVTVDNDGNFWCLLSYTPQGAPYPELHVYKVNGDTGVVVFEKHIETPNQVGWYMNVMPGPGGETLYLMWLAFFQSDHYVYFSILDKDGNFIEEPYPAYDYSDEEVQNLFYLDATSNYLGDVYAVWSAYFPEVDPNAYYVVMGWLDHNWVGVSESETAPATPDFLSLTCSSNPFEGSVEFTVAGSTLPECLFVYDTSGRLVRTLPASSGITFLWDGLASGGEEAPSGLYIVVSDNQTLCKPMQIVKLD